uniref:Helicase ATP-binding domain-containing protein n=1 Tax=Chromera velia CCMP2878 TaxID=1169474 RepID=A0A0G4FAF5_9ALVE|eukprot:Cvel_15881.t1-p1 / transcript=Cvel_15881.t1 / gene=Cvel_15881 / organism=Chromera_velia_CCMP2878 / gene_product=Superkiller viralicidic activity 2-like 2, putative / transcript_product=Superkiller viralicidic activity 2-like 2, putative / location=Cvel_scaffold1198:29651-42211(+) / protein_length=1379 / sequence_SO=supercontig / SO=protein_coding / is_pseudo=false
MQIEGTQAAPEKAAGNFFSASSRFRHTGITQGDGSTCRRIRVQAEEGCGSAADASKERRALDAFLFPFELDAFQKEAIDSIENGTGNILVCAHTSAGKTAVAQYACAAAVRDRQKVVYTSPIKALSNQKYRQLGEDSSTFGGEGQVGIVTGDASVNPSGNVVVMTTEVLRNQLYAGSATVKEIGWVIFDEVHYMRDRVRGAVWEEAIILLPPSVRMLFMSATIPNAGVFAEWVVALKSRSCDVVWTSKRPVPLRHYLFPLGDPQGAAQQRELFALLDSEGEWVQSQWDAATELCRSRKRPEREGAGGGHQKKKKRAQAHWMHVKRLLTLLQNDSRGLLPVIFFCFNKRLCEDLALGLVSKRRGGAGGGELQEPPSFTESPEAAAEIERRYEEAVAALSEEDRKLQGATLPLEWLRKGVGVHHAGLLPIVKEITEILFQKGLLRVLFSTETFGMGLNMPARTVVFTSVFKYDGQEERVLTASEFKQMSGRAGRRGLDVEGHAVIMMDCDEGGERGETVKEMMAGGLEGLKSAFHQATSSVLQLLRTEGSRAQPDFILQRSFQAFSLARRVASRRHHTEACRGRVETFNVLERALNDLRSPVRDAAFRLAGRRRGKAVDEALRYLETLVGSEEGEKIEKALPDLLASRVALAEERLQANKKTMEPKRIGRFLTPGRVVLVKSPLQGIPLGWGVCVSSVQIRQAFVRRKKRRGEEGDGEGEGDGMAEEGSDDGDGKDEPGEGETDRPAKKARREDEGEGEGEDVDMGVCGSEEKEGEGDGGPSSSAAEGGDAGGGGDEGDLFDAFLESDDGPSFSSACMEGPGKSSVKAKKVDPETGELVPAAGVGGKSKETEEETLSFLLSKVRLPRERWTNFQQGWQVMGERALGRVAVVKEQTRLVALGKGKRGKMGNGSQLVEKYLRKPDSYRLRTGPLDFEKLEGSSEALGKALFVEVFVGISSSVVGKEESSVENRGGESGKNKAQKNVAAQADAPLLPLDADSVNRIAPPGSVEDTSYAILPVPLSDIIGVSKMSFRLNYLSLADASTDPYFVAEMTRRLRFVEICRQTDSEGGAVPPTTPPEQKVYLQKGAAMPLLDPVGDLGFSAEEAEEIKRRLETAEQKARDAAVRVGPFLDLLWPFQLEKASLQTALSVLEAEVERDRVSLSRDDQRRKLRLFARLGLVSFESSASFGSASSDGLSGGAIRTEVPILTSKGRAACLIASADELLTTELLVDDRLPSLPEDRLVAALSSLVLSESFKDVALSEGSQRDFEDIVLAKAEAVAEATKAEGIEFDQTKFVEGFHKEMMDFILVWMEGKTYAEARTKIPNAHDGVIIRCMRSMDQLLKEMILASEALGMTPVLEKLRSARQKFRRGIAFSASLYL